MKMPWDFIAGTDYPNEPGFVPAESHPVAAELGEHIARFADAEYSATGRDTRCATCAFRAGTPANTSFNAANATKCAIEGTPFHCHESDRPCGGWVMLQTNKSRS